MDAFTISRALSGTRCWCRRQAIVTRVGDGIMTHYCARHWALWWTITFQAGSQTPLHVTESTSRRGGWRHA